MESLADGLSRLLEPLAAGFRSLGIPEPITRWGHPVMMAIVVLAMGSTVAWAGWQGRLAEDPQVRQKNFLTHRQVAPLMTLFLFLGYSGGVLSLVMQQHAILASPHFWTGTLVLVLLAVNGTLAATNFGGGAASLRTVHAALGTGLMGLLLIHGVLGLQLGFSL